MADNLVGLAQRFNHLLTLFPPADGEVALLEQVVDAVVLVHVLQQFSLHAIFCEPESQVVSIFLISHQSLGGLLDKVEHDSLGNHVGHGSLDNVVVG